MHISTKCSVAVHCLVFIYEYGEKTAVTSRLLSASTGINAATIRGLLSALKKNGLISVRLGTGGAALSCSPQDISLYRVCAAIEPDFADKLIGLHASPSKDCPVGRNIHSTLGVSYQKIRADLCAGLKKITLRDILADYHKLSAD